MKTKKIYLEVEVPERVDIDNFITHKKLRAQCVTSETQLALESLEFLHDIYRFLGSEPKSKLSLIVKQNSEIISRLIKFVEQKLNIERSRFEAKRGA